MSELLTPIDNAWRYRPVFVLIILLVIAFFGWANFSQIDQQVRGVGRIIPAGKTRTIQHLEGGIIKDIKVTEGQKVEAGDQLYVIENKRAESDLRETAVQLKAYTFKLRRLESERESMTRDQFEDSFTQSFTQQERENYKEVLEAEKQLFNARRQAFVEKINGLQERLRQKELRLSDLRTQAVNLRSELSVVKEQLAIKQNLMDKGAISRSQYLETDSTAKNFKTRIAQVEKEIPVIRAEREEIMNLLAETQQTRQSEIVDELNDVKIEIKKLRERSEGMRDQVLRTTITSPVKGVINKLYINTIGGVVQPGATLAEIIPIEETLIVEGRIKTDDRGKIWPGLPVVAKITAYDYSLYGGIDGKLTYISADSFTDKQGNEFYQIRATLESDKLDEEKLLFPGMTVEVNVIAGKISIMQSIMRPLWNIRENALREY